MKIIDLDALVFGVDDMQACSQYLVDCGLKPGEAPGHFEALDGTAIVVRRNDDPGLLVPLASGSMLRRMVYGVADERAVEVVAAELGKDRELRRFAHAGHAGNCGCPSPERSP